MLENTAIQNDSIFEADDKIHFFGVFANNTAAFRFVIGDKILIRRLVHFINNEAIEKNFVMPTRYEISRAKNTIRQSVGIFFGQHVGMRSTVTGTVDLANLKVQLFEKVQNLQKSVNLVQARPITEDMVRVINAGARIRREIICVYCPQNVIENEKPKTLSAHTFVAGKSASLYWTLSDFKKHLKDVHAIIFQLNDETTEEKSTEVKEEKREENIHKENENKSEEKDEQESPVKYEMIQIEPIDMNVDAHDLMYTQIASQMLEISKSVIMNKDETGNMKIQIGTGEKFIQVAKIHKDGSCLFAAMAHQIFCESVSNSSGQHSERADQLRAEVVAYIGNNYERFRHALRGRIFDIIESSRGGKKKQMSEIEINERCKSFLDEELSSKTCWGGHESLVALRELYKVNILIFREVDSFSFVEGFEPLFERTVCLAYRLSGRLKKIKVKTYNHYDSICGINNNVMFDCAQLLVSKRVDLEANEEQIVLLENTF